LSDNSPTSFYYPIILFESQAKIDFLTMIFVPKTVIIFHCFYQVQIQPDIKIGILPKNTTLLFNESSKAPGIKKYGLI